ncbi:MAG: fibronectin type III domain-containing protein [Firmicutes bacterium]|nr:fibronectin type III domain-containing protein [Bacillota bacterium]
MNFSFNFKKNSYAKKIIAVILVALVTFGVFPPVTIFANPQGEVHTPPGGGIVNNLAETPIGGPYNFTLHWVWGPAQRIGPPTPGLSNIPTEGLPPGMHQPEQFDIEWRNASIPGEDFLHTPGQGLIRRDHPVPVLPESVAGNVPHSYNFTGALTPGSIYAFRVVPWHWHHFPMPAPPAPQLPPDSIQMVPPRANMAQNLFLTDINVEVAHGQNGGMLVTWDNPLFGDPGPPAMPPTQVFPAYQLMYRIVQEGGTGNNPADWIPGPVVNPDTPGLLVGNANATWSFEFMPSDPQIGPIYEVQVVPYVSPGVLIHQNTSGLINIGGNIFNFDYSGNQFTDAGFYLRPQLNLTPDGNRIFLTWSLPTVGRIDRVEVRQLLAEPGEDFVASTENTRLIQTFMGVQAELATSHILPRPTEPSWFIIRVIVLINGVEIPVDGMWTNYASFFPGVVGFDTYAPTIRSLTVQDPLSLDIQWRAFTRPMYNPEDDLFQTVGPNFAAGTDEHGREFIIDTDIVFDVFITDSLALLGDETTRPTIPPITSDGGLPANTIPILERLAVEEITGATLYDWFFTNRFTTFTDSGTFAPVPFQPNSVYYIRIEARRPELSPGDPSDPSFGSIYIPPTDPIDMVPPMIPVRVLEDEDGMQVVTDSTITIEWNDRWFEAYNPITRMWSDTIGRTSSGELIFGRGAENQNERLRLWELDTVDLSSDDVQALIGTQLGPFGDSPDNMLPAVRLMDISNANITHNNIHVVEYNIMTETAGADPYEAYLNIVRANPGMWTNIGLGTLNEDNLRRTHEVNAAHVTAASPLNSNTSYVIFFWPQNQIGPAVHPSYTSATTGTERPPLDITPTVPVLRVERDAIVGITEGTTDHSITVSWNGSDEMEYELRFSELLLDYPTGGTAVVNFDDSFADIEIIERDGRLYYTVTGLFPNTMYYFWIRARATGNLSVWSNPVNERTLDIQPPQAPHGLRLASSLSLGSYNAENGTTYAHGESPNRLILEWNRIFADINNEFASDAAPLAEIVTGGTALWLDSPTLTSTFMALIDDLIPNRRYHVRIWTVLTVTRGATPTGLVRSYSYRMQVADNEDFLDFIEIIIPGTEPLNENPSQMRRIESLDYHYRSFFSGQTDEEYDGDVNPDLFPLPDRDWELIYDPVTDTLTFRFRTNQIDQMGARDQNVDQRFISRLVQERVFTYTLDLSTYNNMPVANSVVEMPFSIINAFDERQIALELTTGNLRTTFTPGSLATAEGMALSGVGPDTTTRLMVSSSEETSPNLQYAASYASVPRQISAQVVTPTRTLNFDSFAEPLQLAFVLDNQAALLEQNIGLYTSTDWTGGWERLSASHSPVTGELQFETYTAGSFAAIAQAAPPQTFADHPARDAFLRVNAALNIRDMDSFNAFAPANATVINNLIAAVAMRRTGVTVNTPVDSADMQALARGQVFVPSDLPDQLSSRQLAIPALVTLYERGTGTAVTPTITMGPPDIVTANPDSHFSLIKALELGFINGDVRPTEPLTMGDLFEILDVIIMDMR